jgi:hypothetical protein
MLELYATSIAFNIGGSKIGSFVRYEGLKKPSLSSKNKKSPSSSKCGEPEL